MASDTRIYPTRYPAATLNPKKGRGVDDRTRGRTGQVPNPPVTRPRPAPDVTPHYVVEVLGRPYPEFGRWWVRVKARGHGGESETLLAFTAQDAALGVGFGHYFLT